MNTGDLHKQISDRYSLLSKLIPELEKKIRKLPEGRLRVNRRGDTVYYYLVDSSTGHSGRLIKDSEKEIIEKILQRSYYQKIIKASQGEMKSLKHALDSYPHTSAENLYDTIPQDRREYIKPIVAPDDKYIEQWLGIPFTPKQFDEGVPYFETLKGERVRSKSEQIIADRLAANNIPYKYECPLKVGKEILHPDFTILRLSDRQEIYYEHLGMMDDEVYANRNIGKLNKYSNNGFLPGKRLFTTFETSKVPLDVRTVDKLINEVFR